MSIVGSNALAGASGQAGGAAGFQIDRSLRFDDVSNGHLRRTPSTAGNRKTWTLSFWIKRTEIGGTQYIFNAGNTSNGDHSVMRINSDQLQMYQYGHGGDTTAWSGGNGSQLRLSAKFRDPSAWMHIVVAMDTTQATQSNRLRYYVNGVEQTDFSSTSYPVQNSNPGYWNAADMQCIGGIVQNTSPSGQSDYYLAEVHMVDGQQLAATDFGELDSNSVWQPKNVSVSSINDGTVWSNGWDSTYINSSFPGTNSFDGSTSTKTLSNNNSTATWTPSSGISIGTSLRVYGRRETSGGTLTFNFSDSTTGTITISATTTWYEVSGAAGKTLTSVVIGKDSSGYEGVFHALEIDGEILVDSYNNSTGYGTNGFHLNFSDNSSNAALGTDSSGNSNTWTVNNFTAKAPGLAAANQNFGVLTYTGNGTTNTAISGLAFQSDFVWIKSRDNARSHMLFDSVRGAQKRLLSNENVTEDNDSSTLTAFTSNGFTVNTRAEVNLNNENYVAWCWKAGGTAVSNTDGTITSSVSANPSYGFSIVSYTGSSSAVTVGHGLNAAPKMIIVKDRDNAYNWQVAHSGIGADESLLLNATDAKTDYNAWNNTRPTSSVFSLGAGTLGVNTNGADLIAYCFADVTGYQKLGTVTGSGSDQTITTGFCPQYVFFKATNAAEAWLCFDRTRDPSKTSAATKFLEFNNDNAEVSNVDRIEWLADGFKVVADGTRVPNVSGTEYIYMAIAGTPAGEEDDSLIDTPTNYTADSGNNGGNYATLNPLAKGNDITLSEGNLHFSSSATSNWRTVLSTIGMSSGKWYFEAESTNSSSQALMLGIALGSVDLNTYLGASSDSWAYYENQQTYHNGSGSTYGESFGVGDIIGIAFDADNGTLTFYKNGSSQGNAFTGLGSGTYFFAVGDGGNTTASCTANFGQRPFAYTPPTGFLSLVTTNLSDPTIADGSTAFDIDLYTGTSLTHERSNFSFNPDLVWIKNRNSTYEHLLFDSVRGATKYLKSNSSAQEQTNASTLSSFDSDGFTLGGDNEINKSSFTYCAWAWDAGTSNTTISAGGLNSSVYNQSQTWSNYLSGNNVTNAANAFDGSTSTIAQSPNAAGAYLMLTYTFTNVTSLRVYASNPTNNEMRLNNTGSYTAESALGATSNAGWRDLTSLIPSNGTVTHIEAQNSSTNGVNWAAIEVNGSLLINSGVSVNNVPSIASTVRANPSAGFSIVSWSSSQGATIGHGLNATPELIIAKSSSNSQNWAVYTKTTGVDGLLSLNQTSGFISSSGYWHSIGSSVFGVVNTTSWNNTGDMIAYCFAPVEGFSAFGSYTGNGNADGPFVALSFSPRWVMVKDTTGSGRGWRIWDSVREPNNVKDNSLHANDAQTETYYGGDGIDFLSNGFKFRSTGSFHNTSGNTYIYVAFSDKAFSLNGGLAR